MAVFTFLFCFLCSISPMLCQDGIPNPPSFNLHDDMKWQEKEKIIVFCEDLFKKAILSLRQIIDIRDEHDIFISYNVGMIMGRIREKYRFMSETYREMVDAFNNASWVYPPGIRVFRPLHYIVALERMHYLETEIDKLVDVLVDEAERDLISDHITVNQTERPKRDKNDKGLYAIPTQAPKEAPPPPKKNKLREAAEKSFMRERYLMRKLGNPVNMTTAKKRFLRNWPVEESWSLDKYNHDYK